MYEVLAPSAMPNCRPVAVPSYRPWVAGGAVVGMRQVRGRWLLLPPAPVIARSRAMNAFTFPVYFDVVLAGDVAALGLRVPGGHRPDGAGDLGSGQSPTSTLPAVNVLFPLGVPPLLKNPKVPAARRAAAAPTVVRVLTDEQDPLLAEMPHE